MSIKQYVEANYTEQQKEMFEYLVNSYPSTMLEDPEGNEYDDGYLTLALLAYVLGDTRSYINNLDTQMSLEELVSKIKNTDLSYIGETLSYDGNILSIAIDDTYIYVGGVTTRTVRKYLKSNLTYIGETPSYGNNIFSIAIDDTYIYAGGLGDQTVKKYLKSDLSYVGETPSYGSNIETIAVDDTHIYVGGWGDQTVKKYLKSDLSYVDETPSYNGDIHSIAIDDTYIYVGGTTTRKVIKYPKSDLSQAAGESDDYGGTIRSIAVDDTYIYVGGDTVGKIRKYLKSSLACVSESTNYGSYISSIAIDDTYVYASGVTIKTIRKYLKSDLLYVGESDNYGGIIRSIAVDDTHIYVGGSTTQTVRKYLKTGNNSLQNKKLLLLLMDFINVDLELFNKSGEELLESLVGIKQLALSYYDIMKNAGTKKAITQLFRAYSAYANVDYKIEIQEHPEESAVYIIANKLPESLFGEAFNEDYKVLEEETLLHKLLSKIKPAGVTYLVVQGESIHGATPPAIAMCEMPDDHQFKVTMTNEQNYKVSVDADISMTGDTPIYVGGGTTRTVKRYLRSDLSPAGETSVSYGGIIRSMAIDDTHIYVGGQTTNRVRKYLKTDLSYVGETLSYGGAIQSIAIDDTHIYVGGDTTRVRKYLKTDLSYVGETPNYGGTIYSIAVDDTYVYVGGISGTVRRYLKSNLDYDGKTPSYDGSIRSIAVDDTHIYIGGTTGTVRKYPKDDLSSAGETSVVYGGDIYSIAVDNTHVYVGGDTFEVKKYSKDDLIYAGKTPNYGGAIRSMAIDDTHVYVGGQIINKVKRYSKDDLLPDGEASGYGGTIYSIVISDTAGRAFIKKTLEGYSSEEYIIASEGGAPSLINVELTTSAVLKKPDTTTRSFDVSTMDTCNIYEKTATPSVDINTIGCVTTPSSYGLACNITNNDNTEVIITIKDNNTDETTTMGTRTVSVGPNKTIFYHLITNREERVTDYNFTISAKSMYKDNSEDVLVSGDANCPIRLDVTKSPTIGVVMCQLDTKGYYNLVVPIKNNDDDEVTLIINGSTTTTVIDAGKTKHVNITKGFIQNPYSYTFSLSAEANGKAPSSVEVYSGIVSCPVRPPLRPPYDIVELME